MTSDTCNMRYMSEARIIKEDKLEYPIQVPECIKEDICALKKHSHKPCYC